MESPECWVARQSGVGFRQKQSLRSWILAHMRYITADLLWGGWAKFGGFQSQLHFLAIVLHLAVAEYPGAALIYGRIASEHIEKPARDRGDRADFFEILSSVSSESRYKGGMRRR